MDMIKYNTPQELFTAICDSIRTAMGINGAINHQDIPDKIDEIMNKYNELVSVIDANIQRQKTTNTYKLDNNNIIKITSKILCLTNLTTVNLPECTFICDSAFYGCTSLTTVNLPECTDIRYCTFKDCTSLTTVNLPKCTNISIWGPSGERFGAFCNCTNLTTLIINNDQSNISSNAFSNTPIENGTGCIYVPDNSLNDFRSAYSNTNYQFKPISELPSNLKEEYGYE